MTLAFSPCPNDTFIFDALVNRKIDTEGLELEVLLEDVETLNGWALEGKVDITKLSFPALFRSADQYVLLNSGSALGKGVGPLLISKTPPPSAGMDMENKKIALPGENTTANLLFSFAWPRATKKEFMVFSAIEDAVLGGQTDLGVIIHENRFTYRQRGLHQWMDLGDHWEKQTGTPIPLGGIAMRRSIDEPSKRKVERLIKKSLDFAFSNYPLIPDYVKQYSQTMSEDVMRRHIDLYVNNYSLDLGPDGRAAIEKLLSVFNEINQTRTPSGVPGLFTDH